MNRLLEYRIWARERTLAAAALLPAETYTQELVSSFRSIRDTLVHLLSADETWSLRLAGVSPAGHLLPEEFPDVAALKARWAEIDNRLREVVADPDRPVTYRNFAGAEFTQPVEQIVQHLVNHQTYHLGQVATLLRQVGAQPPNIDLISLFRT
jgi:uncharacterized damage-inducible protein DinB